MMRILRGCDVAHNPIKYEDYLFKAHIECVQLTLRYQCNLRKLINYSLRNLSLHGKREHNTTCCNDNVKRESEGNFFT